MDLRTQFRHALDKDKTPSALYDLLIELRQQGISKSTLLDELEKLRQQVDEKTEDIILDHMDYLVGYCSPHWRTD